MNRAARFLSLSGPLGVLIFIAAHLFHASMPGNHDALETISSYYRSHSVGSLIGAELLLLGAFALLVFSVVLQSALKRAAAGKDSTAVKFGFGGSVILSLSLAIAAGLGTSLGAAPDNLDPVAIQAMHALFNNLFAPIALGSAAFLCGYGTAVIVTKTLLPVWFGIAALPFALLSLIPEPIGDIGPLGLGVWVIIAGVWLTVGRFQIKT